MLALSWNVLDWRGPQFLGLFASLMVVAFVVSLLIVRRLRHPRAADGKAADDLASGLSPYEAAYLIGGADRLAQAGVASLYRRGCVKTAGKGRLKVSNSPSPEGEQVERDLYSAVRAGGGVRDLRAAAGFTSSRYRKKLVGDGLLLSRSRRVYTQLVGAVPFLLLGLLGVSKILVGVTRGKPVGFLFGLCIVLVIVMVISLKGVRRTALGELVRKRLRKQHERTTRGRDNNPAEAAHLAAWTCAVFGTGVLVGEMPELKSIFSSGTGGGGGWIDSGGGSDGGDGGCGGGCGGCGGCG